MNIVADENIPLLREFFGGFGSLRTYPGRTMTAAQVKDADVLLVRSVTRVDASLLEGSRVRFVGTATIGCDHIDLDYIRARNVAFASAPGCNAQGVVEYVLCSLSVILERLGRSWSGLSVGIVGLGNVGSRLKMALEGLGCRVLANDPLLQEQGVEGLVSLDEVLSCDVISLHTPLTKHGRYSTWHLLDETKLRQISPQQVLINTARGPIIEEAALLARLKQHPEWPVVLDVWETEPKVNPQLLELVQIGSPHIAGYSLDGKMRGTEMIYQALCRYLSQQAGLKLQDFLPAPPLAEMRFNSEADAWDIATTAMRACYDPRTDDALLRKMMSLPAHEHASGFDRLRKNYRVRREFGLTTIHLVQEQVKAETLLKAAGFKTSR